MAGMLSLLLGCWRHLFAKIGLIAPSTRSKKFERRKPLDQSYQRELSDMVCVGARSWCVSNAAHNRCVLCVNATPNTFSEFGQIFFETCLRPSSHREGVSFKILSTAKYEM